MEQKHLEGAGELIMLLLEETLHQKAFTSYELLQTGVCYSFPMNEFFKVGYTKRDLDNLGYDLGIRVMETEISIIEFKENESKAHFLMEKINQELLQFLEAKANLFALQLNTKLENSEFSVSRQGRIYRIEVTYDSPYVSSTLFRDYLKAIITSWGFISMTIEASTKSIFLRVEDAD